LKPFSTRFVHNLWLAQSMLYALCRSPMGFFNRRSFLRRFFVFYGDFRGFPPSLRVSLSPLPLVPSSFIALPSSLILPPSFYSTFGLDMQTTNSGGSSRRRKGRLDLQIISAMRLSAHRPSANSRLARRSESKNADCGKTFFVDFFHPSRWNACRDRAATFALPARSVNNGRLGDGAQYTFASQNAGEEMKPAGRSVDRNTNRS
jgi:hypothetical protein